ncbi:Ribonuclease H-like superfamily [Arabidopsis suecica]|uniref:Ribonuclease H-like superfamily n=1 Tax=Arabidopsis suecica TaxID=45249 RepID=A0A8T2G2F7_ARASU|nr:Ribonuclease H-like superfamily [Arabidopsis suecica]
MFMDICFFTLNNPVEYPKRSNLVVMARSYNLEVDQLKVDKPLVFKIEMLDGFLKALRTRGYNVLLAEPDDSYRRSVWLWPSLAYGGNPIQHSVLTTTCHIGYVVSVIAGTCIFWDVEDFPIPNGIDTTDKVILNIKSALAKTGYDGKVSIVAYYEKNKILDDFHLVPAGDKSSREYREFSDVLQLLSGRGYNVVLALPDVAAYLRSAFLLESMKQITSFLPRGSFFGCILAADRLENLCSPFPSSHQSQRSQLFQPVPLLHQFLPLLELSVSRTKKPELIRVLQALRLKDHNVLLAQPDHNNVEAAVLIHTSVSSSVWRSRSLLDRGILIKQTGNSQHDETCACSGCLQAVENKLAKKRKKQQERKKRKKQKQQKKFKVTTTTKGDTERGNYLTWSRTTKTVLCGRGLWSHVISSQAPKEAKEEGDEEGTEVLSPEEEKWFQEDQAVLALLQNSLETSILEGYSYCETAKELWDTLKNVYGNESNLTRVFEVKKAINELSQEDLEFTKHFGKFRSLWSELESLRPGTLDPKVLHERREQDKVFGLLLTLNPGYNDLIKHLLRSEKLPSLDEVCSKIQKEQGSTGLFGGKSELITANKGEVVVNKGVYKNEDRKMLTCDHCKKKGHTKDKCWLLHPHLKPAKFKDSRAHISQEAHEEQSQSGSSKGETSTISSGDYVRKSDLEALIKSIVSLKESGITFFSQKPSSLIVIDSGASHHMISNSNLLNNIEPALGHVIIANGDKVPIEGIGNLRLFNKDSKAFFMPKFTSNLLSVKRTTKDLNCYAIFGPNDVYFQDIETGKVIGEGDSKGELYVLEDVSPNSSSCFSSKSHLGISFNVLWHARLGHPHTRALKLMLPNMSFDHTSCEACILGKHCKSVFPKSLTIYEKCFDLVHSDVWTSPCVSRDNNKYFVTFIDEKSKYTWITLLPSKDRVFEAFTNFETYVTNQFNAKIKVFRTDNGGEYTSQKFRDHLAKQGIIHQTSCPYTPQQNGVAERKNRHLMEVARSMMFHTSVSKRFWGDAVLTACYLINRTPTKVLNDLSPFEVLNNTKPSINHLRVFGCVCFVLVPGEQRNKLDAKSTKCMFLGYSTTQKGYKCFDPTKNRTFISRDVKFLEDQEYDNKKDWEDLKDLAHSTSDRVATLRFLLDHLGNETTPTTENTQETHSPNQEDLNQGSDSNEEESLQHQEDLLNIQEDHESVQETQHDSSDSSDDEKQEQVLPTPPLRRSTRIRRKKEFFNALAVAHPFQATCSLALVPKDHQAFLSKISKHRIPQTYEEAMKIQEWRDAVAEEVNAMKRNHTWDEDELPTGKKTNAFLQGELEDDVYMTPPPGLEDTIQCGKVLRLRKAIYGLKQSPRAWYHKLSRTLKDHSFKKSESDHTLFTLQSPQGIVIVLIYVDDLIITGDNKDGFMNSKPASTPLEDGYKVNRKGEKEDEKFGDAPLYRKLVGKLIYLTNTRPDICFAVNQVSQHMQVPMVYHWNMVERILRYLKGSSGQGIWMGKNSSTEIVGYCDADYAGDRGDRRSTTGYCTFIGGNLATWKTKKQKVVSCSSAESEYRAMRKLTNELTWLKALLKDLGIEQHTPITMHCDNKAAIYIASNSVFHERTKHIEVDCHKVREKIVEGVTLPCYTRSEDQLADIFTKAASLKVCNFIHGKLGLVDLSHS